jgi:beta-glucosidase
MGARSLEATGDRTGNGWEIHPDGLRSTLVRIQREYAPRAIAVTENGATFPDEVAVDGRVADAERLRYLASHVEAAGAAIAEGVPLIGYFAWSLLDNFEWAHGFSLRFGITHVDYQTQKRTIKSSGRFLAEVIKGNKI